MQVTMTMPKLGVNMTKATISQWMVKEGDRVNEGDHLLDAETDKAIQEIPATISGVLTKILALAGDTVECQAPLAVFTDSRTESAPTRAPAAPPADPAVAESAAAPAAPAPERSGRVRISPLAKKMAKDLRLDYTLIQPASPGARIAKADVLAFSKQQDQPRPPAPSAVVVATGGRSPLAADIIPFSGTREIIANRMSESVRTTARAVLSLRCDVGELIAWRNHLKADDHAASYNDLLVAVLAKALREFPLMNARLVGREIHCLREINVGVAVDTEKGLIVPVVKNADRLGVVGIHDAFQGMLERAKAGKSTPDDLADGTFTITNLGMFDIETFIPIIKPPECAILGVGAIVREPVVTDDSDNIAVRSRMSLTLAFDHRIVDGAPAAKFLRRVKTLIEWPMGLMS